jgi:hypothetical protein
MGGFSFVCDEGLRYTPEGECRHAFTGEEVR